MDNSVDNFLITFLRAVQLSTPFPHPFHRLINRVINRKTRPCEKGRNFELTQTKFKLTPCKLKTRATFPARFSEVINSFSRAIIYYYIYSSRNLEKQKNFMIMMMARTKKHIVSCRNKKRLTLRHTTPKTPLSLCVKPPPYPNDWAESVADLSTDACELLLRCMWRSRESLVVCSTRLTN